MEKEDIERLERELRDYFGDDKMVIKVGREPNEESVMDSIYALYNGNPVWDAGNLDFETAGITLRYYNQYHGDIK